LFWTGICCSSFPAILRSLPPLFPVIHHLSFFIPCCSLFPAAIISRNLSSVICRPGSPRLSFPAICHRRHLSSSAPPYPPMSSGSQAGWWRYVTQHLQVIVVQKQGSWQPCEQQLTAAA
jgi:hypothetical protein